MIAIEFRTYRDSCAVVACAKFCSDRIHFYNVTPNQVSIEFELWWENHSWNGHQGNITNGLVSVKQPYEYG